MPELPEVEILGREIRRNVRGRVVASVDTVADQQLEVGQERLPELAGTPLDGVRRFGKRLALDFGSDLTLLTHLMLVGQWRFSALTSDIPPDPKLTIAFRDGTRLYLHGAALRYQRLIDRDEVESQPEIAALGPDAFSPDFTAPDFAQALSRRKPGVKALLLEQSLIGGIGNTYTDEALFLAGIHPRRRASTLSPEDAVRLHDAVVRVMHEAIEHGGASEMAFVHLDGSKGHYQDFFHVKEREGQACSICGTTIVKETVAGRPTYYCPGHQLLE